MEFLDALHSLQADADKALGHKATYDEIAEYARERHGRQRDGNGDVKAEAIRTIVVGTTDPEQ